MSSFRVLHIDDDPDILDIAAASIPNSRCAVAIRAQMGLPPPPNGGPTSSFSTS